MTKARDRLDKKNKLEVKILMDIFIFIFILILVLSVLFKIMSTSLSKPKELEPVPEYLQTEILNPIGEYYSQEEVCLEKYFHYTEIEDNCKNIGSWNEIYEVLDRHNGDIKVVIKKSFITFSIREYYEEVWLKEDHVFLYKDYDRYKGMREEIENKFKEVD